MCCRACTYLTSAEPHRNAYFVIVTCSSCRFYWLYSYAAVSFFLAGLALTKKFHGADAARTEEELSCTTLAWLLQLLPQPATGQAQQRATIGNVGLQRQRVIHKFASENEKVRVIHKFVSDSEKVRLPCVALCGACGCKCSHFYGT